MSRLFLLTGLLLLNLLSAQAQPWKPLTDFSVVRPTDIQFIDNNRGWLSNYQETVLKTMDGGTTWETISFGDDAIRSIENPSGETIYLLSNRGKIHKTFDNGATWSEATFPSVSGGAWDMSFPTENNGFVTDWYSVKKTTDGGITWTTIYSNFNAQITQVYFVSATRGWICGQDFNNQPVIKYTNDAGISWTDQDPGCGQSSPMASYFDNNSNGFITCGGNISRTTDNGTNWALDDLSFTDWFSDIAFSSPNKGMAVGSNGLIAMTSDGGATWSTSTLTVPGTIPLDHTLLEVVEFTDDLHAWIGADGFIFRTTDGGATWTNILAQSGGPLRSIAFDPTGTTGVAAGSEGLIMRSDDSGQTWNTIYTTTEDELTRICFSDASTCWASANFNIFKSTDAGNTWSSVYNSSSGGMGPVKFADASNGWFSANGTLFKTTDGGQNWLQIVPDPQSTRIADFTFLSAMTGHLITTNGDIYVTADGGLSWTLQTSAALTNYSWQIHFSDSLNGWAAQNTTLLHTIDGGQNWQSALFPGTGGGFTAINFSSPLQGWLANYDGLFLTSDGGQSWVYRQAGWPNYNGFATNPTTGINYTVSGQGLIYQYDCTATPALANTYALASPDSTNCLGSLEVWLNGPSITAALLDGNPVSDLSGNMIFDSMCSGMHELIVTNSCAETDTILVIVPQTGDNLIIDPAWNAGGPPTPGIDSLGAIVEDCSLDYATIDTAYIYESWLNQDTIVMVWAIEDTNGLHLDTATYFLTSGTGIYWFQLTVFCTTKSLGHTFTVSQVGPLINHHSDLELGEKNKPVLLLYPNPSTNKVTVEFAEGNGLLYVYDMQGNLLRVNTIIPGDTVDTTDLSRGVYLFKIICADAEYSSRVIKL